MTSTFALFLVFLVLKLLGIITWSWTWITSPLWGSMVVVLVYLLIKIFFYKE